MDGGGHRRTRAAPVRARRHGGPDAQRDHPGAQCDHPGAEQHGPVLLDPRAHPLDHAVLPHVSPDLVLAVGHGIRQSDAEHPRPDADLRHADPDVPEPVRSVHERVGHGPHAGPDRVRARADRHDGLGARAAHVRVPLQRHPLTPAPGAVVDRGLHRRRTAVAGSGR